MKFTKIIIGLAVLCLFACNKDEQNTIDCLPANLQNGVIAFYPFNAGSLLDESSSTNDLTNATAAVSTTDRNGNANCAYLFDSSQSTEEFLSTTNTNFLNGLNAFSISVWYQPMDSTRDHGKFEVLVSRGDMGTCPDRNGEWSVGLYDCRRAVFGHNNSVWADLTNASSFICQGEIDNLTGTWHHVVAVKDNDNYEIYFNGILNESASGNAGCTNLQLAQDIGDLFIGKYYSGKIDDIIIYNRSLSSAEVNSLFELEPCCQ